MRDPEKRRASYRAWVEAHREQRRQTWRAWWEKHKDVHRARVVKAKMRRLFKLRLDLLNSCGWRCVYCRCLLTMETLTVDHIKPKAQGGNGDRANLAPACFDCNRAKQDRTPAEWDLERFGGPDTPVDGVPF